MRFDFGAMAHLFMTHSLKASDCGHLVTLNVSLLLVHILIDVTTPLTPALQHINIIYYFYFTEFQYKVNLYFNSKIGECRIT